MESVTEASPKKKIVPTRIYVLVYLALALLTAMELFIYSPMAGISRGIQTPIFLLLSFCKAALVAAFYMHLRYDNELYTVIFVLPVLLLGVFAFLAAIT